jgi:tRNA (guanine-N7-)-methyltransferase
MQDEAPAHRPVRSYVLRSGRLTAGQARALERCWSRWGVDFAPSPLDLDALFGRHAPRVLEIGFGNGELLAAMAARHPDTDFLGVEVHEPGVGHCLMLVEELGITNVRVIRHDAIEVLRLQVPDGGLDQVSLFFPDPWPKKRHHKRRIVQPSFLALVARKLAPGGRFRVATDWAPYAEHIREAARAEPALALEDAAGERPKTRFERRGERLGHSVTDLVYRRKSGALPASPAAL